MPSRLRDDRTITGKHRGTSSPGRRTRERTSLQRGIARRQALRLGLRTRAQAGDDEPRPLRPAHGATATGRALCPCRCRMTGADPRSARTEGDGGRDELFAWPPGVSLGEVAGVKPVDLEMTRSPASRVGVNSASPCPGRQRKCPATARIRGAGRKPTARTSSASVRTRPERPAKARRPVGRVTPEGRDPPPRCSVRRPRATGPSTRRPGRRRRRSRWGV